MKKHLNLGMFKKYYDKKHDLWHECMALISLYYDPIAHAQIEQPKEVQEFLSNYSSNTGKKMSVVDFVSKMQRNKRIGVEEKQ